MKTVLFDSSGVVEETFEIGSFPNQVTKADVGWQWKYQRTGESGNLNSTGHKIYVTLKDLVSGYAPPYEKLYDLGCGWAQGQTTEAGTWTKIWAKFASKNAIGYSYWPLRLDPDELLGRLPRPGYMPATNRAAIPTRALIWLGVGRCGNWQTFAIDLLSVQGMTATPINIRPVSPHTWFRTGAAAQGSGGGLPAQTQFPDHAFIQYGNMWDPSYGEGSFSGLLSYEDNMLSQYRDTATYPGAVSDWKNNVLGVLEIQ